MEFNTHLPARAVPSTPWAPSIINDYGLLRKGSRAPLANKLCVKPIRPPPPDVTIIDVSQLLYHIVWPFKGTGSAIVESIKIKLSNIPGEKVLVFDKYHDISAKDHERMRRGGLGSISYDLTVNTLLPNRDSILKNKHNELQLSKVLSNFDLKDSLQRAVEMGDSITMKRT
jgi:hypothetical protein